MGVQSLAECGQRLSRHGIRRQVHVTTTILAVKKVKGSDIYTPSLTGKPEQQRFTMRSDTLTSISSRQRSAISGRPLVQRTDLDPQSAVRQTNL